MANIATWAIKDKRELDKRMEIRRKDWFHEQQILDADSTHTWTNEYGHTFTHQIFNRSDEELWKQWLMIKDGIAAEEDEKIRASSSKLMERAWEYQHLFMQAKERVAERLGITPPAKQTFFITIRPKDNAMSFHDFHAKIDDITSRAFMKTWTLTFEQKGQSDEDLGMGFHTHIWAQTSFRSKGEVLRALLGTQDETSGKWKNGSISKWLNENKLEAQCVHVEVCQHPKEAIKKYAIDYEAKDGHKAATKEWDNKWRMSWGLQPLYTSETGIGHLPVKSNRQMTFSIEDS